MTASVAFLRAPPSWAMAATVSMRHQHDKENAVTNNVITDVVKDEQSPTVRAKCASGVPFLLSAEDQQTILSKRFEQTSPRSPRSVTTKWELYQQVLFGSFRTEETCVVSPFFVAS